MGDTAGMEKFDSINSSLYKMADGVLLVYVISEESSFNSLGKYKENIDKYCFSDVNVGMVGNKADLETIRAVTFQKACGWAKENDYFYFECSSYDNFNVDDCVAYMIQSILEKRNMGEGGVEGEEVEELKIGLEKKHSV